MKFLSVFTLAALLLTQSIFAQEGNIKSIEGYEIHYSVFNSDFISPEVAKVYNIVRGKDKALVNISVLKKLKDGTLQSVEAKVTGTHSDLIRKTPLGFNEVQENPAFYYLAQFNIDHKAKVYFSIQVKVPERLTAFTLDFQKILYVSE